MRGLNTGNRNKTAPFVPFPITASISPEDFSLAADAYFGRMRDWGMDTARMPFSWAALEPVRDVWDEQYLDRYELMVDAAWAAGLRVIVDFHQDIWSENYCGDGFPTWAVADPGAPWHECPDQQWGFKYFTNDDVRGAFDRFFANEDQLVDEFHDMWIKVAERLADHPGVVALEIVNEPGWGTADDVQQWKLDVLTPFHEGIIAVLNELAPDLLIAYNDVAIDAVGVMPNAYPRPEGERLIYAPHLYGEFVAPSKKLGEAAAFGRSADVHVLLGEFGFQPSNLAGPAWVGEIADAVDAERISATMWEYSINEQLWNYENFSMIDAAGNEQVMLESWVRPWLRAVGGSEPQFQWDAEAGTGSASWVSDGELTELVMPRRRFGAAGPSVVEITGDGACFTLDMDRGELRVAAPAGTAVSLSFDL